jgi:hypothetical protein
MLLRYRVCPYADFPEVVDSHSPHLGGSSPPRQPQIRERAADCGRWAKAQTAVRGLKVPWAYAIITYPLDFLNAAHL